MPLPHGLLLFLVVLVVVVLLLSYLLYLLHKSLDHDIQFR